MLLRNWRPPRFFRTLRFRLASTFMLLLAFVLTVMGFVGTTTLRTILDNQSEEELHDQIGALKGYIRFENGSPSWFADRTDPEEEATVGRLKNVFVVTDDQG